MGVGVERYENALVGEFREPGVDGIVKTEFAFLNQDHGGDSGDELAERCDAEEGVALHGSLAVEAQSAEGLNVELFMPADERDETRQGPGFDVALECVVEAVEARFQEVWRHRGSSVELSVASGV